MPADITKEVSEYVTVRRTCSECKKMWKASEMVTYLETKPDELAWSISDESLAKGLQREIIRFKADPQHNIICPKCGGLSEEVLSSLFKNGIIPPFFDIIEESIRQFNYLILIFIFIIICLVLCGIILPDYRHNFIIATGISVVLLGCTLYACRLKKGYIKLLTRFNNDKYEPLAKKFVTDYMTEIPLETDQPRRRINEGFYVSELVRMVEFLSSYDIDADFKAQLEKTLNRRLKEFAAKVYPFFKWLFLIVVASFWYIGIAVMLVSDIWPDHLKMIFGGFYSVTVISGLVLLYSLIKKE
jgi:cytochrome c biogenesis protein CcdA